MNLFILSLDPAKIAEYMMDKHVSKILLEAVQMLCTAKRILDPEDEKTNSKIYKLAHINHPVSIWVRSSLANFMWTLQLVEDIHYEWKYRYDHPDTSHKSYLVAQLLNESIPDPCKFEKVGLTPFALAMPDVYKTDDPVESYRNYYMSEEKQRIASWNKTRDPPDWYLHRINK
jgi:hypothetical protein